AGAAHRRALLDPRRVGKAHGVLVGADEQPREAAEQGDEHGQQQQPRQYEHPDAEAQRLLVHGASSRIEPQRHRGTERKDRKEETNPGAGPRRLFFLVPYLYLSSLCLCASVVQLLFPFRASSFNRSRASPSTNWRTRGSGQRLSSSGVPSKMTWASPA